MAAFLNFSPYGRDASAVPAVGRASLPAIRQQQEEWRAGTPALLCWFMIASLIAGLVLRPALCRNSSSLLWADGRDKSAGAGSGNPDFPQTAKRSCRALRGRHLHRPEHSHATVPRAAQRVALASRIFTTAGGLLIVSAANRPALGGNRLARQARVWRRFDVNARSGING